MIKNALSEAHLAPLAVIGLVLFVTVFVGVTIWVATRGRKQVAAWASLPLADDPPGQGSLPIVTGRSEHGGGCGKCEDCSCEPSAQAS